MATLDIGLRQVPPLPDQHVMLIAAGCNAGKTTAACYIAGKAAAAGLKVTFIDPELRMGVAPDRVVRTSMVELQQGDSLQNIRFAYCQTGETGAGLTNLLRTAIETSDIVVFDEIGRAFDMTSDGRGRVGVWQAVIAKTIEAVKNSASPKRVVFTITTLGKTPAEQSEIDSLVPGGREHRLLVEPIPTEHDPVELGGTQMYLVRVNSKFIRADAYTIRKRYCSCCP